MVFLKQLTSKVNLATGAGLQRGDILLNEKRHVAMYCGNGLEVEASINENGRATGGKPGDQTGREFLIRSYRNYPWNVVLRYTEAADGNPPVIPNGKSVANYGYYTTVNGVKWYLVTYKDTPGFVSSRYLVK